MNVGAENPVGGSHVHPGRSAPRIRQVGLDRPWVWLALGWRDVARAPGISLSYGIALIVISFLIVAGLFAAGMYYLILPMAAGFLLVGPLVAAGLYEVSRRHAAGEPVSIGAALGAYTRNGSQIAFMGVILLLFFIAWMRLAFLIFMLFYGTEPPSLANFVETVFLSPQSLPFLVTGCAVGGVLAATAFAISAVSIPMLLDRETNVIEAVVTSVQTCLANWKTMAGWAGLIVLFTAAGMATMFLGLALALPLIAHASWHAYKDLVE